MVAYVPPDRVLITVGASYRTEPLMAAARRMLRVLREDQAALVHLGIAEDASDELEHQLLDLDGIFRDARARKHDTPLQMSEVAEILARARAWLTTLRGIATLNLSLDEPSLKRLASSAPELAEGYARDVLVELEHRLDAARDLKPRLEEVGLSDGFLARGRSLARQLRTAIGAEDLDPGNLHFTVRRLYARKANIYMLLKRVVRAGQIAFVTEPERARRYHLDEIEPRLIEPIRDPTPRG